jgi:hypothetical protein
MYALGICSTQVQLLLPADRWLQSRTLPTSSGQTMDQKLERSVVVHELSINRVPVSMIIHKFGDLLYLPARQPPLSNNTRSLRIISSFYTSLLNIAEVFGMD